ncbi:MAG: uncharacterized membrane protein (UPF0127 family), partial [Paraglaciecola sp.]
LKGGCYSHVAINAKASENVLYALEMNQGWFKTHGINVGDKMHIQP